MLADKINKTELFQKVLLFTILAISFILSIKQIGPFSSVDEQLIAKSIWQKYDNFFAVDLYPQFIIYIHFFLSLIYQKILLLLGIISSSQEFFQNSYGYFFTIEAGRIVKALFGTGLIYFVFKIGNRFYSKQVAFCASIFIAFNQLFVLQSHIFKTDIAAAFIMTVALYFILKFHQTHYLRELFLASFFTGLAVTAKYNIFPLIFIIPLVIIFSKKELNKNEYKRCWWFFPFWSALGFFTGSPNWLVHPVKNIKLFLKVYNIKSGYVFNYGIGGPDSAWDILSKMIHGLLRNFGLILLIILLLSIIRSFFSKNKRDMLLIFNILFYTIVFIQTGVYEDRFILPLFIPVALLMAKLIFIDLKEFIPKRLPYWRSAALIFWIPLVLFALNNIGTNIKTFNLLKTASKHQWTKHYRLQHQITNGSFRIANQITTKRLNNDIRLSRTFEVIWRKKKRHTPFHFIQANAQYYDFFRQGKDFLSPYSMLTKDYKPFYLIRKKKFQPGDTDVVLLYRIADDLKGLFPGNRKVALPMLYCSGTNTTFLPRQIYEKNSLFIKMDQNVLSHWIYSKKKINRLSIHLLSFQNTSSLEININGVKKYIKRSKKQPFGRINFDNLRPKPFFYDYVYHLGIKNTSKFPRKIPFYFLLKHQLDEAKEGENPIIIAKSAGLEKIPDLFSQGKYPFGIRHFFRKTGIDLTLLNYLNTHSFFFNKKNSVGDIKSDYYPLLKGHYVISLFGQKIFTDAPLGKNATLTYEIHSTRGKEVQNILLLNKNTQSTKIEIDEPVVFIRVYCSGLRENNFYISEILLRPDYPQYIKNNFIN